MTRDEVFAWVSSKQEQEASLLAQGQEPEQVQVPLESLRMILESNVFQKEQVAQAHRWMAEAREKIRSLEDAWLAAVQMLAQVCAMLGVNYVSVEWSEIWRRLEGMVALELEVKKVKSN